MPDTCAEAIRNARAAVDIDKRGSNWIVRHIDSTTIHEGPSMDYHRARGECRRARIKHALIAVGWDDMAAEYAAHVADGAGRFEAVVSLLHKKPRGAGILSANQTKGD